MKRRLLIHVGPVVKMNAVCNNITAAPYSRNGRYALGYVHWFEAHYANMIEHQYSKKFTDVTIATIKRVAYGERWHFSNRMLKVFPVAAPYEGAVRILSHLLKEIKDNVLAAERGEQLEFDFMKQ